MTQNTTKGNFPDNEREAILLLYSVQSIIITFLDEHVKMNNDVDALELWETAKRLNESVGVYSR